MNKQLISFITTLAVIVVIRLLFFYSNPLQLKSGQEVYFTTTLFSDPVQKGNYQQVITTVGDFFHGENVVLEIPLEQKISYGDTIQFSGKVLSPLSNLGNISLKSKSVVPTISSVKIKAKNASFLPFFASIRQEMIDFCENSFSQPYSGLILGIMLGVKNTLSGQITTSYRITGLSHILVIDGMKISLIAGFFIAFFSSFFSKRLAILLSIAGIGVYIILSGLEISALRAGSMAIIAFGAQLSGRQYTGIYSLLLVSGFFLFINPLLLGNVGFQLSVLATTGIIFFTQLLPGKGILWESIGLTLAAQVATVPIVLGTFGSLSLLSFLVHALVMWTIAPIMIISSIGVVLGFISQPMGWVIMQLCLPLLWYFNSVVVYFSQFDLSLQVTSFPACLTMGYYLVLGSGIWMVKVTRRNTNENTNQR